MAKSNGTVSSSNVNRYFVLPDPESDNQQATVERLMEASVYPVLVRCKSQAGKESTEEMWELTVSQVQQLGVERQKAGYHYTVFRLLAGEQVAKAYVTHTAREERLRGTMPGDDDDDED